MPGKKKSSATKEGAPQTINPKTIRENILNIFRTTPNVLFNYKQIAKKLDIKEAEARKNISEILQKLTGEEVLEEVYTGKYKMISDVCYVTGKVDLTQNGYGFIISDEYEEDIFVSMKNLNHALHGDTVKVYLFAKRKKARPEGEVVEIIERGRSMFVGTLEISKNFAFLIPTTKQIPFDIFIPLRNLNQAQNG
jgi:ribonuclease R